MVYGGSMFSIDALIVMYLPIIGNAIMANKFTIMTVFYVLDKCAKYTDTTVDDSIVTFLKNIFLRIIGRGNIVDQKFEYFKQNGLINTIDPLELKKADIEFKEQIQSNNVVTKDVVPTPTIVSTTVSPVIVSPTLPPAV